MNTQRINNGDARNYVARRKPFKGSNLYSVQFPAPCGPGPDPTMPYADYVVYSYGAHFPLYVHMSTGEWLGNADRYSVSTSKHHGQASPGVTVMLYTTEVLQSIIRKGYAAFAELPAGDRP